MAGANTVELARKHRISEATFYNWEAKYGGLEVSEAKRLRTLDVENAMLKRLLADAMLDNETLVMSMGHAREKITAWAHDYSTKRTHSWLGYTTPAAFAAKLATQWPALLRAAGPAAQSIAYPAIMRNNEAETLIATG